MTEDDVPIRIVPFKYADLDWMMEIEVRAFTVPWSRSTYEELAPLDGIHIWVAKSDGEPVGYILYQFAGNEMELHNIAVKPELLRRGIGTKLMDHMLVQAESLGVNYIYLLVRPSNTAARMLYEKYGFEVVGVRHRYYRDDNENALILCREEG